MLQGQTGQINYQPTLYACFTGYVVQAVINNFMPLLFLTFQRQYGIPLSEITLLITINFLLQLGVDLASVFFVDRIGYRLSALLAHGFCAAGLILMTVLPELMPTPFMGLLGAVALYAIGGGLLEVIISPMVQACPADHKDKAMSMLHSFYCWGSVGVVCLSTLYFNLAGIHRWKILALLWAALPLCNGLVFTRVPIAPLIQQGERGLSVKTLFSSKTFWLFMVVILCAGASEQAVIQWSSAFVETALKIPKASGDLLGPAVFSLLMGSVRLVYGKFGEKIDLERMMFLSCVLCILSYLLLALTSSPALGLVGLGLCGMSVGILWPGTFSKAALSLKGGGTAMFALLALAGDLGCAAGPTLVGMTASLFHNQLKAGILSGILFPTVLALLLILLTPKSLFPSNKK